ncbi:MAG: glycoside hydrolase family 3 C-terminal domain-containing protein [Prevotella sp.]|nr:glycoside hydrolase family 3 C-terminal domain-containing protein [Prevotella sp.]
MKIKNLIITSLLALTANTAGAQIYLNPTAPLEKRIDDALSRMTLHEKINMLHAQSKFTSAGVPRLGIRQLNMDDGPHGVREELEWNSWSPARWTNDYVVAFPSLTCLAATWNRSLSSLYGKSVSEEFAFRGKDVMLGPGTNIARTPYNGRAFEYLGEDPYLAGEMLVPYIKAAQSNGIACCLKHFALNDMETDRFTNNVNVSERALNEIYLAPFKKAVEQAHVWTIMGSYNLWLGQHCCENDSLLNGILKRKWGFDGAVISDWGGTFSTMEAALGGLDIEMGTDTDGKLSEAEFTYNDYFMAKPLEELVKQGKISEEVINDKARRVLRTIFRTAMNPNKTNGSLCSESHYDACRAIGEEGIVLLKNTGILPLRKGSYKHILVVGDNAVRSLTKGGGSSELKTLRDISPLDGIKSALGEDANIDYAQGYEAGRARYNGVDKISPATQKRLHDEAIAKAKNADLIIFIGGLNKNCRQDCENGDRESYSLPYNQDKLISDLAAVQKNMVVATFGGNAFAMPWLGKTKAMLHCWYLGSEAGTALADILTGKANPSGRLPVTIAHSDKDYAFSQYGERAYPGIKVKGANTPLQPDRQVYYDEDLFVGYRHFSSHNVTPLFPFGFGLSYTSFAYGKPQADGKALSADGSIKVSINIKNTGKKAGKETVQLYIGEKNASKDRPRKELKDFQKIELQPGESQKVTFLITPKMLQHYSEQKHDWTVSAGTYNVWIGKNAADEQHKIELEMM